MQTYQFNKKAVLQVDHRETRNGVIYEISGYRQLGEALSQLMDKEMVKKAKTILRREAKPLIVAMRANIKKSKKKAFISRHRHFTKSKGSHTIDRTHKPGELRRSIGTLSSKKYRYIPLIYVGNRRGIKQRNDGWYGHFTEFGTKRGIKKQEWSKRAIQSAGDRVVRSIENELFKLMGKQVEK